MAKLKARIGKESWEKLTDAERLFYTAIDGGAAYVPDIESVDGWGLENIHGLKSAYERAMSEKRALEKQIKEVGPDAAMLAELTEVKAQLEAIKKADPAGKAKTLVADEQRTWNAQRQKENEEFAAREARLRNALDSKVRKVELQNAFAAKNARADRLAELVQLSEGRVKMVETADGRFDVSVVNADGTTAYSKRTGRLTEPMGLDEIAEEFSSRLPEMFQGHAARGTGSGNAVGGRSGGAFSMSREEVKSNPAAYVARKEAAMRAGQTVTLTD